MKVKVCPPFVTTNPTTGKQNTYDDLCDVLVTNLFGNGKSILTDRYNQMQCNFNFPVNKWAAPSKPTGCRIITSMPSSSGGTVNLNDVLLEVPIGNFSALSLLSGYQNVGHDLPFWLEPVDTKGNGTLEVDMQGWDFPTKSSSKKQRIMIVSQDPLRGRLPGLNVANPYSHSAGSITLSSPFGMHSQQYRGNELATQIFAYLLYQGHSLYFTDARKLYATNNVTSINIASPIRINGKSPQLVWEDILRDEISLYQPDKIIAFGNDAEKKLLQILPKLKKDYFFLYHYNNHFSGGRGAKKRYYQNELNHILTIPLPPYSGIPKCLNFWSTVQSKLKSVPQSQFHFVKGANYIYVWINRKPTNILAKILTSSSAIEVCIEGNKTTKLTHADISKIDNHIKVNGLSYVKKNGPKTSGACYWSVFISYTSLDSTTAQKVAKEIDRLYNDFNSFI